MENQNQPTSEGTTPTHNPEGNWIADREAAHLAAFQEVRRMDKAELAALLGNAADDCAERAGDLTDHDEALPDLMREAACRLAAGAMRKGDDKPTADETTKAERQVLEMILSSYKPRDQRDLAEWLVSTMSPDTVKGLAADYDEASA